MSILLTGERNVKCNMKPPLFLVSLNSLVSFSLGPYNIDSVLKVILLCWNTFTKWTATTLHIAPLLFFAQLPRIFHYRTWGFFVSTATAAGTWINTAVVYLHCTHTHTAWLTYRKEERRTFQLMVTIRMWPLFGFCTILFFCVHILTNDCLL